MDLNASGRDNHVDSNWIHFKIDSMEIVSFFLFNEPIENNDILLIALMNFLGVEFDVTDSDGSLITGWFKSARIAPSHAINFLLLLSLLSFPDDAPYHTGNKSGQNKEIKQIKMIFLKIPLCDFESMFFREICSDGGDDENFDDGEHGDNCHHDGRWQKFHKKLN